MAIIECLAKLPKRMVNCCISQSRKRRKIASLKHSLGVSWSAGMTIFHMTLVQSKYGLLSVPFQRPSYKCCYMYNHWLLPLPTSPNSSWINKYLNFHTNTVLMHTTTTKPFIPFTTQSCINEYCWWWRNLQILLLTDPSFKRKLFHNDRIAICFSRSQSENFNCAMPISTMSYANWNTQRV